MQEVRQAFLLQRLRYGAIRISHEDVLGLATGGGARLMGRSDIGEIAVGKQADLALFSLDEPRFAGAADPVAALVLCGAHRAEHVMIKGEWRVTGGRLVSGDVDALLQRQERIAATMRSR